MEITGHSFGQSRRLPHEMADEDKTADELDERNLQSLRVSGPIEELRRVRHAQKPFQDGTRRGSLGARRGEGEDEEWAPGVAVEQCTGRLPQKTAAVNGNQLANTS
jgi:hypothetical protein